MSADQDDNTLNGLPPLPPADYRPGDEDDVFSSFDAGLPGVAPVTPSAERPFVRPVETPAAPPRVLEEDEDDALEETSPCVVIGPSNAGKTALLASLDQACSAPTAEDDGFQVALVGGRRGTDRLAAAGIRTIMERDYRLLGDVDLTQYSASVMVTEEKTFWRPARQHVSHLDFRDGPGGVLFRSEKITEEVFEKFFADKGRLLLQEAKEAETLVLCVDSTDPRPDVVSQYMRNILARVAELYTPVPDLPPGYRLQLKLRQGYRRLRKLPPVPEAPPLRRERRLNTKRFLLLLTKVDQLLSRQLDWEEGECEIEPPRPADLVGHLSPVETACELLDESNLMRILNALKPEARFAVGLTSAWGFDPSTGRPFMERDEPVALSAQDRSRRVLNWRPYGVREALLFITAGVAVGPVEQVKRAALLRRTKRPELEIDVPPTFFDPPNAQETAGDDDSHPRGPRRILV